MPDVPGVMWHWQEEPDEGVTVRAPGGRKFKKYGDLWFDESLKREVSDEEGGWEWDGLLEAFGKLYLWRETRLGDLVSGFEIRDLPKYTVIKNEYTGQVYFKVNSDEWVGRDKDGEPRSFSWTEFVSNFIVVWMDEKDE